MSQDAAKTRAKRRRRPLLRRPIVPGAAPGQMQVAPGGLPGRVRVIRYAASVFTEHEPDAGALAQSIADARAQPGSRVWVRVEGLHDQRQLEELARAADIHHLAMEDVVHIDQRAKVDVYDGQALFVVVRVPVPQAGDGPTEQLSLFLRKGLLVTFEERASTLLDPVVERLARANGRIRVRDSSYLLYAVIDTAVDAFFPVLEQHSERVVDFEEAIARAAGSAHLAALHAQRRRIGALRRDLRPLQDAIAQLLRDDIPLIADATDPYLADCQDHAQRLLDFVEQLRDEIAAVVDLHVTMASHRMNEIIKLLTVISTIFIPLTFLAGIYGMNFDPQASPWNMPELQARYGYVTLLSLMLIIAGLLLWWFRRKGFLGETSFGGEGDPQR